MIPLALFKNREFSASAITIVISNLFLVAVTVLLPTFFTKVQNKGELEAALLITPITFMIFIFSPISAFLLEKLGSKIIVAIGFILMACSYKLFTVIDMNNVMLVIVTCLILGAGYGIITGPITVMAASNFKGSLLTASQSVVGVLRQVGICIAIVIYVSGLYANMNNAKSKSLNYANIQVNELNIPNSKKNIIIDNTKNAIINNKSNTEKQHFSHEEINDYIFKTLKREPSNISKSQKENIKYKTKMELLKVNNSINKVITKIKEYSKSLYSEAFINLYKISLPFIISSVLICFLFPSKRTKKH